MLSNRVPQAPLRSSLTKEKVNKVSFAEAKQQEEPHLFPLSTYSFSIMDCSRCRDSMTCPSDLRQRYVAPMHADLGSELGYYETRSLHKLGTFCCATFRTETLMMASIATTTPLSMDSYLLILKTFFDDWAILLTPDVTAVCPLAPEKSMVNLYRMNSTAFRNCTANGPIPRHRVCSITCKSLRQTVQSNRCRRTRWPSISMPCYSSTRLCSPTLYFCMTYSQSRVLIGI